MAPSAAEPLSEEREEDDANEFLQLAERLFPLLVGETVVFGVVGGVRRGRVERGDGCRHGGRAAGASKGVSWQSTMRNGADS